MGVAIRRAGEGDREAVTRLLDEAFQNDPVSSWVFPDAEHRRRRHPLLMGAFVDAVLAEGYVDVTEDGSACALWLSMPAEPTGEDDEDGPAQMREEVDPENERVELIGRLTAGIHPEGQAHEYLWMIAVAPGRQGRGSVRRLSSMCWTGVTAKVWPRIWRRAVRAAEGSTSGSGSPSRGARSSFRTGRRCGPCGVTRRVNRLAGRPVRSPRAGGGRPRASPRP